MAFSNQVYGIISQVGERIYDQQDKKREKANTVVVAIGTVITALLGAGTFLLEANLDGLPGWVSTTVVILGMVGTLFGVSRTKNGITPSVLDQINKGIADMIDAQEGSPTVPHVPEPVAPSTSTDDTAQDAIDRSNLADTLDSLAKRIAQNQD